MRKRERLAGSKAYRLRFETGKPRPLSKLRHTESAADALSDLLADAAVRFRELRDVDRIEMSLAAAGAAYDVGDQIHAAEQVTGLTVTQTVKKKIVTIRGGEASITCEIGGKIT